MGPSRILVSDLDGTLLGYDAALDRFGEWLNRRREDQYLVYASGRGYSSVQEAIADHLLPVPDAIICSVGTEIVDQAGRPWPGWAERFNGSPADRVREVLREFSWLTPQGDVAQTRLKASYDVHGLTASDRHEIRRALTDAGIRASLVYSGGLHLDVLPQGSGKGVATRFLAECWGIDKSSVLAFGDSGNDADLLASGFRGTMVANALPELRAVVGPDVYQSTKAYADGVLDGIHHWTER